MHVHAVDIGIRAGEVDEFHRADGQLRLIRVLHDLVAVVVHHHDLTRTDVTYQFGADDVERAGFGSEHIRAVLHLAKGERTETVRIECADHGVLGHNQIGETAMHDVQRFLELVHKRALRGAADEVHQHFGVGIGMEDRTLIFQLAAQGRAIREIAVMTQRHIAVMETEDERLDVVGAAGAGSGIAHMADRPVAFESFDFTLVAEYLGQQTRSAMTDEMTVIVGDNAGTLLTTMLQRVQTEVSESGGVRVAPNAENTAFLVDVFEFS